MIIGLMADLVFGMVFFVTAFLSCGGTPLASGIKSSGDEEIKVYAKVEPTQFFIDQTTKLTISVDHPLESSIVIPDRENVSGGLSVSEFGENLNQERDRHLYSEIWFGLAADSLGSYRIPSIPVTIVTKDQNHIVQSTQEIFVTVVAGDSAGDKPAEDIRDIKPNIEVPSPWLKFVVLTGGIIFLFGGILMAILRLAYWRRENKSVNRLSPMAWALQELNNLAAENLIQKGAMKTHFTKLSHIMRRYLEDQFSFGAVEMTSEEISSQILALKEFDHRLDGMVSDFLREIDLIKFAQSIPREKLVHSSINDTRMMIEKSKVEKPQNNPRIPV
jgi:hypothetical protein